MDYYRLNSHRKLHYNRKVKAEQRSRRKGTAAFSSKDPTIINPCDVFSRAPGCPELLLDSSRETNLNSGLRKVLRQEKEATEIGIGAVRKFNFPYARSWKFLTTSVAPWRHPGLPGWASPDGTCGSIRLSQSLPRAKRPNKPESLLLALA